MQTVSKGEIMNGQTQYTIIIKNINNKMIIKMSINVVCMQYCNRE